MKKESKIKAVPETVDNSAEILARRAEKEADAEKDAENLRIAQEQFKKEAAGQPVAPADPLLRWFQSEGMDEPFASVVQAYGNLAKALSRFMKPSDRRTLAVQKLLESKDEAIRAMFSN